MANNRELTCEHCGHQGTDVHMEKSYVGGQGYVIQPRCDDERACWLRWAEREEAKKRWVAGFAAIANAGRIA